MMRLPAFEYRAPATVEEAARILAGEPGAQVVGGGTDLFPNMKRRHQEPRILVSLRHVASVQGLLLADDRELQLGASLTLTNLASERLVPDALRVAASQVATPLLRNAATLGGNVCLDTRCTYYDQNYEWREAIGFCMKKDGTTCWVAPSSARCLAVSSTDCAPALIALDAEVHLVGTSGERRVALADLYRNDGIEYLTRRRDEIVTRLAVPDRTLWRTTYWKLRRRGSIDFPVLSIAAALKMSGNVVEDARLVLGAVASSPQVSTAASQGLIGHDLSDERIAEAAAAAARLAKPMDNTDFQLHWRKAVAAPFISGALRQLRGDDPSRFQPLARRAAAAAFSG
jgi:4-hydroxybenzoyl-CoA reductase subunit beta